MRGGQCQLESCKRCPEGRQDYVRYGVEAVFFAGLVFCGGYFFAGWVPLASSGSLRAFALSKSADLREEFGMNGLPKVNLIAGLLLVFVVNAVGALPRKSSTLLRTNASNI